MSSYSRSPQQSRSDDDDVITYYNPNDSKSRSVGIHELDLNTLYPQHPLDYKNGSKYCFIGKPGCHKKGTKIILYNGTHKNVEDITINDVIMGDDSTPRNVLSLCRGREKMYEIIPREKGWDSYIVNENHILSLKSKYTSEIIDISLKVYLTKLHFQDEYVGYRSIIDFPQDLHSERHEFLLNHLNDSSQEYLNLKFIANSLGYSFYKNNNKNVITKSLISSFVISPQEEDDYYGFELDGNNRYVINDFTVTHNTGKSSLIKSLLYSKKHIFPVGAFWSGTEDSNGFFKSFAPDTFIRDGMIDAKSESDMKPLESLHQRQKISRKYLEPRGDNPWCVEVLDDCTADTKFLKKTVVKDGYKNGRHKAKMHILSLQYCMDIPADIRGLIDGTFICRESNTKNRMKLFENFGSCVDNINDWNDLMDGLTDDYCCMYVNGKSTSNKIEDNIFYYKADIKAIPKDWKFGCGEYWEFHYDRYNPNSVDTITL